MKVAMVENFQMFGTFYKNLVPLQMTAILIPLAKVMYLNAQLDALLLE